MSERDDDERSEGEEQPREKGSKDDALARALAALPSPDDAPRPASTTDAPRGPSRPRPSSSKSASGEARALSDEERDRMEERLAALSSCGLALEKHRDGPIGGFWPEAVRIEGDALVVDLDRAQSPSARFAARLATGALTDAAYMAPEVATGEVTDLGAADVWSLAASAYEIATGKLPVGRLDVGALQGALGQRRFTRVLDGLSTDPSARPTLRDLALALTPASSASASSTTADRSATSEPRGPARARGPVGTRADVDDDGAAIAARAEEPRSFVRPLLMVGAVSVFTGAVWFIWLAWWLITDIPRLLLITAFTAVVGVSSEVLKKHLFDEAATTLRVLFTQLFWAIGGLVLAVFGALESETGWAVVALAVAGVSYVVGDKRGPKGLLLFVSVASTLLACVLIYADLGTWGRVVLFVGLSAIARIALFMSESLRVRVPLLIGVLHISSNALAVAHLAFGIIDSDTYSRWRDVDVSAFDVHLPGYLAIAAALVVAHAVSRHYAHTVQSPGLALFNAVCSGLLIAPLVVVGWKVGGSVFGALPPLLAAGELALHRFTRDDDEDHGPALAWLVLTSSLWLTAATIAADVRALDEATFAVAGALIWAFTVVVAWRIESSVVAWTAPVHLAIAALALGEHLSTGSARGPTQWFFVIALTFVGLASVLLRRDVRLRASHLAAGVLFAIGSTLFALGLLEVSSRDEADWLFAAAFAYAPAALMALLLVDRLAPARFIGAWSVLVLFALPAVELFFDHRADALSIVATAVGLAGVALGTLVLQKDMLARVFVSDDDPTELEQNIERFVVLLVVVATVTTLAPALLGSLSLLDRSLGSRVGEAIRVVLPLSLLYGLGMGAESLGRERVGRVLQLVAALTFLVIFTLTSFAASDDYGHPAVLFLGGVALLVLGVRRRHPHVVFWSSGALIVGFWTQFFMKLHTHAPVSVLLIVFGVGVLVGGILYERHVKSLVVNVRSWPGL